MSKGVFTGKEREAIALLVSKVNSCDYCLAGHSALAIKRGFTQEETLDIRRGRIADSKLNAIIQLAKSITETKDKPAQELLDKFYEAGFNETGLMDLTGQVILRIFTNYVFALTAIPVDYRAAKLLN